MNRTDPHRPQARPPRRPRPRPRRLVAAMIAPASGFASAPVKFGAKLNSTVQPSNSLPGLHLQRRHRCAFCPCTMVQNEAYGRPDGGELAPKTGTIKKIRLIAGGPGSFRLQIAKVNTRPRPCSAHQGSQGLHNGPKLCYHGPDRSQLRKRQLQGRVLQGQHAGRRRASSSPSTRQHQLDDPLLLGRPQHPDLLARPAHRQPLQGATDADGCWILMEAVIR